MAVRKWRVRRGLQADGDSLIVGGLEVQGAVTVNPSAATIGGQSVKAFIKDSAGNVLFGSCTTVPADGQAGFAKGCLLIDTDVAAGTTGLYVNVGTTAAANFDAVSDA